MALGVPKLKHFRVVYYDKKEFYLTLKLHK